MDPRPVARRLRRVVAGISMHESGIAVEDRDAARVYSVLPTRKHPAMSFYAEWSYVGRALLPVESLLTGKSARPT